MVLVAAAAARWLQVQRQEDGRWLVQWCAELARSVAGGEALLFVVAGRGATMVREGCGNGGCSHGGCAAEKVRADAGWMRVDGGAKQDGDGVTTVAGEIGGGGGCRGGWKGN
ncbi:hypothetical protein DEO72_LG3g1687 [Vigna unguiculata]|uniref:Uncharacterized protein n=1 Tax=Vigna unguiculata TaxID=3917 RepID=A0A4D6LFA0_VIGUN|nr:hypothetical protein DEO72_LG3g1687 [Vigna unguiculata]